MLLSLLFKETASLQYVVGACYFKYCYFQNTGRYCLAIYANDTPHIVSINLENSIAKNRTHEIRIQLTFLYKEFEMGLARRRNKCRRYLWV